ncbi:DUF6461 domain-containing protein [Streptomyces acidicola]|uniref:DUF6461 domain-containing protein n=1 Tax=Streptomyces acidicola TaxID=2596892 RepID=UPI0038265486
MDLFAWHREFGAACFTLAPTTPRNLLTALGVTMAPEPVGDLVKELRDHREYAWLMENIDVPEDQETPLIAAAALDGGWSVAVEVDGMTGYVGCRSSMLQSLSRSFGRACSCYYDTGNAQVFTSAEGAGPLGVDTLSGRRHAALPTEEEQALTDAGFAGGDFHTLAPRIQQMRSIERLDVALNALTGRHLVDCINAADWIAGQTHSR